MRVERRDAWSEHMRTGNFSAAWRICDRVLDSRRGETCFHLPRHLQWIWNGSPVDDRHVLVRCYHGLGDTIQFARFLPMLQTRARSVTVWAQPRLIPLLETLEPRIRNLEPRLRFLPLHDGDVGIEYDEDVEIMELAHVFRTTLDALPAAVPYFSVDAMPLARNCRPSIGLVWRAGDWDTERSIPFSELSPLIDIDADWYVLQGGDATGEPRRGFGTPVGTSDIGELAAAMRGLDLVITIDSMTAHLAGALAVPVWTLVPYHADWRWMEDRSDSPWYPTLRLFRQPSPGDWHSVIACVTRELAKAQEFLPAKKAIRL
jgi:hypothetical protein